MMEIGHLDGLILAAAFCGAVLGIVLAISKPPA